MPAVRTFALRIISTAAVNRGRGFVCSLPAAGSLLAGSAGAATKQQQHRYRGGPRHLP